MNIGLAISRCPETQIRYCSASSRYVNRQLLTNRVRICQSVYRLFFYPQVGHKQTVTADLKECRLSVFHFFSSHTVPHLNYCPLYFSITLRNNSLRKEAVISALPSLSFRLPQHQEPLEASGQPLVSCNRLPLFDSVVSNPEATEAVCLAAAVNSTHPSEALPVHMGDTRGATKDQKTLLFITTVPGRWRNTPAVLGKKKENSH